MLKNRMIKIINGLNKENELVLKIPEPEVLQKPDVSIKFFKFVHRCVEKAPHGCRETHPVGSGQKIFALAECRGDASLPHGRGCFRFYDSTNGACVVGPSTHALWSPCNRLNGGQASINKFLTNFPACSSSAQPALIWRRYSLCAGGSFA